MESAAEQLFSVCWNEGSYISTYQQKLAIMQERNIFTDVAVSCDDGSVMCHRVVLAACSPYLADLLIKTCHISSVICLPGVKRWQIEALVSFMYRGRVDNISRSKLAEVCEVAKRFQIEGLGLGQEHEIMRLPNTGEETAGPSTRRVESPKLVPPHPPNPEKGASKRKKSDQSEQPKKVPKIRKEVTTTTLQGIIEQVVTQSVENLEKKEEDKEHCAERSRSLLPIEKNNGNPDNKGSSESNSGKDLGNATNSGDIPAQGTSGGIAKNKHGNGRSGNSSRSEPSSSKKKASSQEDNADSNRTVPFREHQGNKPVSTNSPPPPSTSTSIGYQILPLKHPSTSTGLGHRSSPMQLQVNETGGPYPYLQYSPPVVPLQTNSQYSPRPALTGNPYLYSGLQPGMGATLEAVQQREQIYKFNYASCLVASGCSMGQAAALCGVTESALKTYLLCMLPGTAFNSPDSTSHQAE